MDISEIKVGDIAFFDHSYIDDFEKFSFLSKDFNPLHHDNEYALNSGFKAPIVLCI